MSFIQVLGIGVVSPAGWGIVPLRQALKGTAAAPEQTVQRPGWERGLRVRAVPPLSPRPASFGHPRLRRSSPVSQYSVAAALEAMGDDAVRAGDGSMRLGIIQCVMSGCVNYSRRFYDEVLRDPGTASPLLFPETVFNAPGSHLAALLGTTAINYTLVGDPGTFLQGLALGAQWLCAGLVDRCLVVGTEEFDWLTADAFRLFSRRVVVSEGAGVLYLGLADSAANGVQLAGVTDPSIFFNRETRARAATRVAKQLCSSDPDAFLCNSILGVDAMDQAELLAWRNWPGPRISPKKILGEGLMAAAAWQCVAAVDAIRQGAGRTGLVSVVGCNQQAIGARFTLGAPQ